MHPDHAPSTLRRRLMKAAAFGGIATLATQASAATPASTSAAADTTGTGLRLYNPEGSPPGNGYSHVGEITDRRLVFIAGQVAVNADGQLVGAGDFRAQLEQVFANLGIAIRAAGGHFGQVVKLNYYCVDSVPNSELRNVAEVRNQHIDTVHPPISTFVFVSRLARPEWLIEIEAVLALPPRPTPVVVLAELDFDSDDRLRQAMALAREVAGRTREEPGCLHYAYGVDVSTPNRLQLSEWWRDDAALQAHLRTPHLTAFRQGLRRLGGSRARVRRYAVGDVGELALPPLPPA
jgi:enamine deaminase RidA (YjgF/YER057c/UK114 family)/quinol monooxygenase YgiN